MATIIKLNKPISVIDNKMYITELGENIDENNLPEPTANWRTKDIVVGDKLCKISNINGGWVHAWNGAPYIGKSIFKSNLDNLESGIQMFANGVILDDAIYSGYFPRLDFISDLPNLKNGTGMFEYRILDKFVKNEKNEKVNLSNLEIGDDMFYASCINTDEIYSIDMPKLKSADSMFYSWGPGYTGSKIYTGNLKSLENGCGMFYDELGCSTCNEFYGDLPALKYADWMYLCDYKFRGSLPSLITGYCIFGRGSKLDALSIFDIVTTIPDRTGLENKNHEGTIDIGLGCKDTDEDRQLYAEEGGFQSFQEILDRFAAKNWEANLTCNGRPRTTYSLRENISSSSPIWVKIEEINLDNNIARFCRYTSQDGSKKINLKFHHFTSGNNEGYTQFNTLEEAIETLNIKPIERN